jgi:non-ribosomal peptide synthetase component F
MWVCSGEVLTGELLLEFYDCFPPGTIICNYYGSTEVMGDVTYAAFRSREDVLASFIDDKIPIGKRALLITHIQLNDIGYTV